MKRYKFIGKTEHGMGYINGHIYDLDVVERSKFERVIDQILPPFIPMDWRVFIRSPRPVPYTSMETFRANWKEIDEVEEFGMKTEKILDKGGVR